MERLNSNLPFQGLCWVLATRYSHYIVIRILVGVNNDNFCLLKVLMCMSLSTQPYLWSIALLISSPSFSNLSQSYQLLLILTCWVSWQFISPSFPLKYNMVSALHHFLLLFLKDLPDLLPSLCFLLILPSYWWQITILLNFKKMYRSSSYMAHHGTQDKSKPPAHSRTKPLMISLSLFLRAHAFMPPWYYSCSHRYL